MRYGWRVLLILTLAAVALAGRIRAQIANFPHDEEFAGAAGDLILRGPWVTPGKWRSFPFRVATFAGASLVYEEYIDKRGWSSADVARRLEGFLLTEGLVDGGTWAYKKLFDAPAPKDSLTCHELLAAHENCRAGDGAKSY